MYSVLFLSLCKWNDLLNIMMFVCLCKRFGLCDNVVLVRYRYFDCRHIMT